MPPQYGLQGSIYSGTQALGGNVGTMIGKGTQIGASLFMSQVYEPTVYFTEGFMTTSGATLKDPSGNTLIEWFALDLHSRLTLSDSDPEGDYQVAVLSDDGSMLSIQQNGGTSTLVSNDGEHPTRMGCSTQTIHLNRGDAIPFDLQYYQGPRYEIALTMMWRPVVKGAPQDSLCGATGNNEFWDPSTNPSQPTSNYRALLSRGWKVLNPQNFLLQPGQVNPCNPSPTPTPTPTVVSYPDQSAWASAAFEDRSASQGSDFDFNDTIVNFNVQEMVNSSNQITDIAVRFMPRAACAGDDHAILFNVTGNSPNIDFQSNPLFVGGASAVLSYFDSTGAVIGQNTNVAISGDIVIFPHTNNWFLGLDPMGNCFAGQTSDTAKITAKIQFHLNNPASNPVLSPSIDVSKLRVILHDLVNQNYVDLIDVNPSAAGNRSKSYGVLIPMDWRYDLEGVYIGLTYPIFEQYVQYKLGTLGNVSQATLNQILNWFNFPNQAVSQDIYQGN